MFSMRKLNCTTTNRLILWEFLFGFVKGCFVFFFFFFPRKNEHSWTQNIDGAYTEQGSTGQFKRPLKAWLHWGLYVCKQIHQ